MQPITKNLTTFALYFTKQYKWHFFAMTCFRMSSVLDNLVVPYAFKVLTTKLMALDDDRIGIWKKLIGPVLGLLLVLSLIDVLFRLFEYVKIRTIPSFESHIRMWIVHYLHGHSYQFFVGNFAGDLAKRVNDLTDGVSQIMMLVIGSFLPTLCTILVAVFSFAYIQPAFGIILMGWLLLHSTTYLLYSKKCNHYVTLHAEKLSFLSGSIVDGFTNNLSIKLFAQRNQAIAHLRAPQAAEKQAHENALTRIMYLHFIISGFSIAFMGIGLIFYLIHYWQLGKLTVSEVTYIFFTGINICNLVWLSVGDFPDFFEEVGYCRQALQLLQKEQEVIDLPTARILQCTAGAIAFKHVHFSYVAGGPPFVTDQNVYIAAGEKIGLVGLSGSGKTTFVHLLLRFFNLDAGVITIDDQDISLVTQESLRAAISLIPQEATLFHDTILENIRYGRQEATDSEVILCAKKAKCHDFIMQLSSGYDTLVGERGSKLSGGQRQRIVIARAILKNAQILILDEATSALDAITEIEMQESVAQAMVGKTAIVIAHRLSVLSAMDRIFVFDQGKIVAQGSHTLLLSISPLYREMCKLQSSGLQCV